MNSLIPAINQNVFNVRNFGARGNGVADDRASIVAAIDAALLNLPATVYFPQGTYGISGGIEIKPEPGSRGLLFKGDGVGATTIAFNGATSLVSAQYVAFAVKLDKPPKSGFHAGTSNSSTLLINAPMSAIGTPNYAGYTLDNTTDGSTCTIISNTVDTFTTTALSGGTDNDWDANDKYEIYFTTSREGDYIKEVTFMDMTFTDNNPSLHQTRNNALEVGTCTASVDAEFLTHAEPAFTINEYAGQHLYNSTTGAVGYITANTAQTVTAQMAGGTSNFWNTGDGFQITTASGDVEESHGISIKHCEDTIIKNISLVDIGDEGINTAMCNRTIIEGITAINTPSIGFSGSAISITAGSRDTVVTDCTLRV